MIYSLFMLMKEYIKKVREGLGYTQAAYARLLGVERSTVANYETAKIDPSARVLLKIMALDGKCPF